MPQVDEIINKSTDDRPEKEAWKRGLKPSDVFFFHSPCWGIESPPIGAAYVSAYLQARDIPLTVRDLNVELYHFLGPAHAELWRQESYRIWELANPFFEKLFPLFEDWFGDVVGQIVAARPKVICCNINVASVIFTAHLVRQLKQWIPGLYTIFGGTQTRFGVGNVHLPPGLYAAALGEPGLVDALVLGEGECTIYELASAALQGRPLVGIPGAVTAEDGFFGTHVSRPVARDLDDLGYPTFDGFPLELYRHPHLPVLLSRGCRFRCTFCNERLQFDKYRSRSGEHMFDELVGHQDKHGVSMFHFCDLAINAAPKELETFADKVIESGRDIVWSSQAVVHKAFTRPELLQKLHRSGCDHFIMGVETFSRRITQLMGKPYPPSLVEKVLRTCFENGIGTVINVIVGFPGETEEDLEETIAGLRRNAEYISMVSSVSDCIVAPGSVLEQHYQEYGMVLPEKDRFNRWYMPGNDHQMRMARIERVLEVLEELGLDHMKTTRYDETLAEALDGEEKPRIIGEVMTVMAPSGIDRSSAAPSFVPTSVEEDLAGPSAHGDPSLEAADPGWIESPVTPMPDPYALFHGRHSQVRMGGRSADLFYRGHLVNRGQGLIFHFTLSDGRVFKTEGAVWSWTCVDGTMLALLRWPDDDTEAYIRIAQRRDDTYRVDATFWPSSTGDEALPDGPIQVELGLGLYDLYRTAECETHGQLPTNGCPLPDESDTLALVPIESGFPLPRLELYVGRLKGTWALRCEVDPWVEACRMMLFGQVEPTTPTVSFDLNLSHVDPDSVPSTLAWRSADGDPGLIDKPQGALDLCRVEVRRVRADGRRSPSRFLTSGDGLVLHCTIYCRKFVENPMLRVQITAKEGSLVVGMNNYRARHFIEVDAGCFTRVAVRLDALALAPGPYSVSVALADGEGPQANLYAFNECTYQFIVCGMHDQEREVGFFNRPRFRTMPLPAERGDHKALADLEPVDPRFDRDHESDLTIRSVQPYGQIGQHCVTSNPGEPLSVVAWLYGAVDQVAAHVLDPDAVAAHWAAERKRSWDDETAQREDRSAAIDVGDGRSLPEVEASLNDDDLQWIDVRLLTAEGLLLHRWLSRLPVGTGNKLLLEFESLRLLRHEYRLEVSPVGRPFAGEWLMIHGQSKRVDGGGLLAAPVTFRSRKLANPGMPLLTPTPDGVRAGGRTWLPVSADRTTTRRRRPSKRRAQPARGRRLTRRKRRAKQARVPRRRR